MACPLRFGKRWSLCLLLAVGITVNHVAMKSMPNLRFTQSDLPHQLDHFLTPAEPSAAIDAPSAAEDVVVVDATAMTDVATSTVTELNAPLVGTTNAVLTVVDATTSTTLTGISSASADTASAVSKTADIGTSTALTQISTTPLDTTTSILTTADAASSTLTVVEVSTAPADTTSSSLTTFDAASSATLVAVSTSLAETQTSTMLTSVNAETSTTIEVSTTSDTGPRVASGVVRKWPLRLPDEEPPVEEFTPVFIEEELMARKDFRVNELRNMSWTVEDPKKAVFYMVCCGPIERILLLPPRTPERPYICYDCDAILQINRLAGPDCTKDITHKTCHKLLQLLERRDMMFSSSDLRWWNVRNDTALQLPGITHAHHLPSPDMLLRTKVKRSQPPHYFLTFQGARNVGMEGTSFVRLNLEAKMNSSIKPPKGMRGAQGEWYPLPEKNWTPPEDVVINIAPDNCFKTKKPYWQLFDSVYSLVLHGHGRWSYRLMEALCGEAIPVVMAEGWELPFSELIDWDQLTVQRPESMGFDPAGLVESLPRDPAVIEATRQNVQEVYQRLMSTQQQRLTSLLRSAALWKRNWRERERSTLRMVVDQTRERQRAANAANGEK